jgi:hypothetical protein
MEYLRRDLSRGTLCVEAWRWCVIRRFGGRGQEVVRGATTEKFMNPSGKHENIKRRGRAAKFFFFLVKVLGVSPGAGVKDSNTEGASLVVTSGMARMYKVCINVSNGMAWYGYRQHAMAPSVCIFTRRNLNIQIYMPRLGPTQWPYRMYAVAPTHTRPSTHIRLLVISHRR